MTGAATDRDAAGPPAAAEVAASRGAVYRLLGRLYLQEVDDPALAVLREWPAFGRALDAPAGDAALLGRLRGEYARLFLLNAYPYESVYVDPSAMLNTEASAAVARAYDEAGFAVAGVPRPGAPDHVGAELLFVAALVERGQDRLARRFLERHLGAFVAPFALTAARDARHPFYRVLAELTVEFVLADLDRLAPGQAEHAGGQAQDARETSELPSAERESLAAQDLAGVAAHLATPMRAGLHLSREELHRLARGLGLSLSLLERPRMIEMLFEGAGRFGQLPALLDRLAGAAASAAARYDRLAADYPAAGPVLAPWRQRAGATAVALRAMRREAASGPR